MRRKIIILGSTGSIGTSTLKVVEENPDHFEVVGLSAHTNVLMLTEQIHKFKPQKVCVGTKEDSIQLSLNIPSNVQIFYGTEGLKELVSDVEADFVMNAIVGAAGLIPTLEAISSGKDIGLANKETLVAAGHIVTSLAKEKQCNLYPIDSEHSAIFQCLQGEQIDKVEKLIVTASGGPFRTSSREEMESAKLSDALKHPNWSMGAKITVDSATLMNKGFEVLEAHWFFDIPFNKIDVLIHPESIVHSMVQFVDGSVKAQLGMPDMYGPIQYAMGYPHRLSNGSAQLDLTQIGKLHFYQPDLDRFPCLKLAYEAGSAGGSINAVLNSANEIANAMFREEKINFLDIERVISATMDQHVNISVPNLEEIMEADRWARQEARLVATKLVNK